MHVLEFLKRSQGPGANSAPEAVEVEYSRSGSASGSTRKTG